MMRSVIGALTAGAFLIGLPPLAAGVITGQSEAFGVSADLTLSGALDVQATVSPTPLSQGTAPPPYDNSASLATLSVDAGALGVLGGTLLGVETGLLETRAFSNVDGAAGPRTASATSTVNDLALDVVSVVAGVDGFVRITATTIRAMSTVSGDFGALVATGSTLIEDLVVTVGGVVVANFEGVVEFAPNTGIAVDVGLAGATLIINEQIVTGDGITFRGIETNAIALRFDASPLLDATLDGEVIVAGTSASLTAAADPTVPEPGTMTLLALGGLGMLGGAVRKRRKTTVAA